MEKFKEFFKLKEIRDKTERTGEIVKWLNQGIFSRTEILLDYIDYLESHLDTEINLDDLREWFIRK